MSEVTKEVTKEVQKVLAKVPMKPVAAFVASSTVAYLIWSYLGEEKPKSKYPLVPLRPGGLPWAGNIEFGGEKSALFKTMEGKPTRFKVFNQQIVMLPAFDYSDEVYKLEGTHLKGGDIVATFKELLGTPSLLAAHGEEAKNIRRVLLPVFRPSDLIHSANTIQDILNPAFKRLSEMDSFSVAKNVEAFAWIMGMTFVGIEYEEAKRQDYVDATHEFLNATLGVPIDLGKWSAFGRGKIARRTLIGLARSGVEIRKKKNATGVPVKNDILQRMLSSKDEDGQPMSEMMLLNNILVFLIGSFDTTCSSLMSVLINMCTFKDVQEKVHEHVRDVLGEDSDEFHGRTTIPEERWPEFDYIEQVVYETQRFTPPMATSSGRTAMKAFDLGKKYHIEKDTVVMLDTLSPTRFEKYWPNPHEFDPSRFDRKNPKCKKNIACLNTFGGGRRRCIGEGFAKLELKIFMALLFRDYKVEFADPKQQKPKIVYPFTFLLDEDLHIKFTKRAK